MLRLLPRIDPKQSEIGIMGFIGQMKQLFIVSLAITIKELRLAKGLRCTTC
jgi:hypothetical protein